jgi:formate/nitrite transporter FocA (FNT family)
MYFIPLGAFLGGEITIADTFRNLVPVTLGNLVGGAGMVGLVYHTIYRHGETTSTPPSNPERP